MKAKTRIANLETHVILRDRAALLSIVLLSLVLVLLIRNWSGII